MRYEWDDEKNARNREKHGITSDHILDADWNGALTMRDNRKDYGEDRFLSYVPIHGRLHAVIYVKRAGKRRIISLRKANTRERNFYEKTQA